MYCQSQLIQIRKEGNSKKLQRRAVAPIIATLLLVAIAVVGGSIVFVFAQGYVSGSQISGVMQPEHIVIFGYDSRDISPLKVHDGLYLLPANCCGDGDDGIKSPDERITIFVQNNSAKSITILELRFGGTEYQYVAAAQLGPWQAPPIGPNQGEYVIMTGNDGTNKGDILQDSSPIIQSGGIVTLVLDLDRTLKNARDLQIKLTTTNGNVFVSTVNIGQIVS